MRLREDVIEKGGMPGRDRDTIEDGNTGLGNGEVWREDEGVRKIGDKSMKLI